MAVDAAIDDQARADDGIILAGLGEQLRLERDFETARRFLEVDILFGETGLGHVFDKGFLALIGDVLVPARLNEGDAFVLICSDGHLVLPWFWFSQNQGKHERMMAACITRS
jgi:hypothetical protein